MFTQGIDGQMDTFSLTPTGAALAYLIAEIAGAGPIRLIIAPHDPSVAATYAGFSNTTFQGSELRITAVPEPSAMALGASGL